MLKPETIEWVRKQKKRGYPDDQLASYLRSEGYSEEDIRTVVDTRPKRNVNMAAIVLGVVLVMVIVYSYMKISALNDENEQLLQRVDEAEQRIRQYEGMIQELQNKQTNPQPEVTTSGPEPLESETTESIQQTPDFELKTSLEQPVYFPYDALEWTLPEDKRLELQILNDKEEDAYIMGKITCRDDYGETEVATVDCKLYGGYSVHDIDLILYGAFAKQGEYNCVLSTYETDEDCEKQVGGLKQKQFKLSAWPA